MKTMHPILLALTAIALAFSSPKGHAQADDHTHEKKVAGPNGGRVIKGVEPRAEFFVTTDRKVQITFLGDDGRAVAPTGQVVTVTAGDRSSPTKLTFTRAGKALLSDGMLPAGNDFPTVLQVKATPSSKPVYEKFNLNLASCGECKLSEYACICHDH